MPKTEEEKKRAAEKKKQEEAEKKKKEEDEKEEEDKKKKEEDDKKNPKRRLVGGGAGGETNSINGIEGQVEPRGEFSKKPEQGDLEMRQAALVPLPKNPDLSMKKEGGEDMVDDRSKFGGVRMTSKTIEIDTENFDQFADAPNQSVWLGFVRIGKRVGKPHDSLKMYQIVKKGEPAGKYIFPSTELKSGQSWHEDCLNKAFAAKPDSSIKMFNFWSFADVKAGKKISLVETGCYFGFFLIKAKDGGNNHYLNFSCATLNQAANSVFSDKVPDMPENKMNAVQKAMFRNMIEAEKNGFGIPNEFAAAFKGVPLVRGILDVDSASKKMPLSWARAVWEALKGDGKV